MYQIFSHKSDSYIKKEVSVLHKRNSILANRIQTLKQVY